MMTWGVLVVLVTCCCAMALPAPRAAPRAAPRPRVPVTTTPVELSPAAPHPEGFRLNVFPLPAGAALGGDLGDGPAPSRQLSQSTQSFLSTLGTALGPIVGAIVGPLLTNIGQNLSAGSGAQAISQLQQAAQAAAQQQGSPGAEAASRPPGAGAGAGAGVAGGPPPRPARPVRPGSPVSRPVVRPAGPAPRPQSFDAFVLDVPGRGPFLFLMAPNASEEQQSAAIQQAQQQATQLFSANTVQPSSQQPWSLTDGVVSALSGPTALATKPTSAGPLPVRPSRPARPGSQGPSIPSYHSLLEAEDGTEEVAVDDTLSLEQPESIGQFQMHPTAGVIRERENQNDYPYILEDSDESLTEKLFPEMS